MSTNRRICITGMAGVLLSACATRGGSSRIDPPFRLAERRAHAQVYLLGGAAPKDRSWLVPKIRKVIETCDVLWQEDPPTPNVFNQSLNIELGRRTSGDLWDDLNAAEQARVAIAAKTLDLPMDLLRMMKPWAVGAVVAAAFNAKPTPNSPPESGQLILQDMALARGIPVKSEVEQWDDWVRFYASFPQRAAVQYMLYQMDISELPPDSFERWSETWLRGDESDWQGFNDRLHMAYPDLYEVLEVQRNERWVTRVEEMMAGGVHLINVGVQHTVGPGSIQVLAARRGIRFRRI